jgi:hypothetical protein
MKKIYLIAWLWIIIASIDSFEAFGIGVAPDVSQSNMHKRLPHYDATKFSSLFKALNIIGNEKAVLAVSNEQIVRKHISIPANIILRFHGKGVINIAPTAEILISGPIYAERNQIFSGSGVVTFAGGVFRRVCPEWWGAKRDGRTDDTGAVQTAVNSLSMRGGEVSFADGVYVVDSISLVSNISIIGSGLKSVLEQKKNAKYCCSINPGNGGSADPKDNKQKIRIHNLHFRGTVAYDGFSEHTHLLNINAATDVVISDCWFSGWRGDGIFLGSGNSAQTERHNRNITIKNCRFDGVNNDNRNAISVIDSDGVEIDNNSFTRCTRSNMPGAIDMEPDANRFSVIRNIRITRNRFSHIGGNVGIIALVLPLKQKELVNPSRNILIRSNTINGLVGTGRSKGISMTQNQNADDADIPNDITITGNEIKKTGRPFVFWGVKGVIIDNNVFDDAVFSGLVSYTNDYNPRDIMFKNNVFSKLGSGDGYGITVFNAEDISFIENTFDDIGSIKGRNGIAIDLSRYLGNNIRVENNHFKGMQTTHAVLMDRARAFDSERANNISRSNSFAAGIESVSFR